MIGDTDYNVSKLYDMLPASTSGDLATRTAADNMTVVTSSSSGRTRRSSWCWSIR